MPFIQSINIDPSNMPVVSPLRSPPIGARAGKKVARAIKMESSTPTRTCSNLLPIFSHEQENQRELTAAATLATNFALARTVHGRRKRWKKPAKKRFRYFGLDISTNVGHYPSNDEEEPAKCNADVPKIRRSERSVKQSNKITGVPTYGLATVTVSVAPITEVDTALVSAKKTRKTKTESSTKTTVTKKTKKIQTSNTKSSKNTTAKDLPPVPKDKSKPKQRSAEERKLKIKSFDLRVQNLRAFKSEHGHCRVPYTYKPNQALSNWCSNLRYSYAQQMKGSTPTIRLTTDRISLLQGIGFDLGPVKGAEKRSIKEVTNTNFDDGGNAYSLRKKYRRSKTSAFHT